MKLKRELGSIDPSEVLVDGPRTKRRKRGSSPTSLSVTEDAEMANGESNDFAGGDTVENGSVKELGLKIWYAVRNAKGKDDRVLSYDFMRLPSKRQYGDYYNLIKRPISLDEIKAQLDSNAYPSIDGVKQDFDTCFKNAKKYNMKESQIWKDAKILHKIVSAQYKMLTGAEDDVDVVGSDGGVDAGSNDDDDDKGKASKTRPGRPPSLNRLIKTRMQKLADKTDDTGRLMTEDFMELPPKKIYPIYYKTIKKLMCFDMIFKRIKRKEYSTTAEFAADVELVFSNAFTFNEEHSPIWEDAKALKAYFRELMADLPAPYALPEYSSNAHHAPAQNGKLKLRVPAPSHAHAKATSPPTGNTPLTVKLPAPSNSTATQQQPARQAQSAAKQASRSPNLAARPPPPVPHVQGTPQASSSYLHPATFSHVHPHHPQPQYQQHSQPASRPQSTPHSISPSPLPPTPTPPITYDRPLRSLTLKTMPLGRTLKLDSSEGVRMWVLRLGKGETALDIRDIKFLEVEESDEEEDEEDDESHSGIANGQGKGEVIVKANGSYITPKVPNKKEGGGVWEVSGLQTGTNVLEVGERDGEIWKVVLQRIGMKP